MKKISILLVAFVFMFVAFALPKKAEASFEINIKTNVGTYKVTIKHWNDWGECNECYDRYRSGFVTTAKAYAQKGAGVYHFTQACGNHNDITVRLIKKNPPKPPIIPPVIPVTTCSAGSGQIVVGGVCTCPLGQNLVGGVCTGIDSCPAQSLIYPTGFVGPLPTGGVYETAACPKYTCNSNNICEAKENNSSCPADCSVTPPPPTSCTSDPLVGTTCSTGRCGAEGDGTMICTPSGLQCQTGPAYKCVGAAIDTFKALPGDVNKGQSCTLSWEVADAVSCKITRPNGTTLLSAPAIPRGSSPSDPIQETTIYTLTCKGTNDVPVSSQVKCKLNAGVTQF
ncbi:MAG: hypothetical protein RL094_254 [Candidatus Parcubacteria bacterium]